MGLHAVNVWQGFGKRKNAVGMARPKKAKVDAREEAHLARIKDTAAADEQGEAECEREKQSGQSSANGTKLQQAEARSFWTSI